MIKKMGSKWCLFTKDGSKKLGCHDTREGAVKQEQAVEISKHRKAAHFHGLAGGPLTLRTFRGAEHVVMPVVMLVEGVLEAVNSPTPELVLAEEFSRAPQGWDGRPVVADHPRGEGEMVSANSPEVLEKYSVGLVFNSRVDGKKLLGEIWLDPKMPEAERYIDRANAGEMIEVSVGVYVDTDEVTGSHNGRRYASIWRNIVPDHLALLPEGTTGACSVKDGCGAPRAAQAVVDALSGKEKEKKHMTLTERFEALREKWEARWAKKPVVGDTELRQMLHEALHGAEPAFLGVESVYGDKEVIYSMAPNGEQETYARAFERGEDGAVKLQKDKRRVKRVTKYEAYAGPIQEKGGRYCHMGPGGKEMCHATMAEAEKMVQMMKTKGKMMRAAGCGCGGQKPEEVGVDKKELVAKVLARKGSPFTKDDESVLVNFSEERLKALAAEAETPEPDPKPEPEPEPEDVKVQTPEERRKQLLDENPDIKEILDQNAQRAARRRTELVTAMKDNQVYSEEELKAMPLASLEKVVRVAGAKPVVDYGPASGGEGVAKVVDRDAPPEPIDFNKRFLERKAAGGKK